jgi:hypothetical protein
MYQYISRYGELSMPVLNFSEKLMKINFKENLNVPGIFGVPWF